MKYLSCRGRLSSDGYKLLLLLLLLLENVDTEEMEEESLCCVSAKMLRAKLTFHPPDVEDEDEGMGGGTEGTI